MTVKSQMINSRKIFAVCCDGILVYVRYIISLQTNYTASSLPAHPARDVSVGEIEAQQSSRSPTSASPTPSASPPSPSYHPEAVFEISEVTVKTGRNKGKAVKRISLVLGNHVFKRNKKLANGKIIFTCNGCEKQGHYLSAVVGTEDEEADKYYLIRAPHITQHTCWISSNHLAIRKAKEEMYEMVLKEPTRGIQEMRLRL